MHRVIVTVKRQGETRVRDLEVPAEVEIQRLAQLIASALHWETNLAGKPLDYKIEAHPPGRFLQPAESLASAGVWDGSWLVFHSDANARITDPSKSQAAPTPVDAPSAGGSPFVKWRPLGVNTPNSTGDSTEAPEEKRESKFTWKQLD